MVGIAITVGITIGLSDVFSNSIDVVLTVAGLVRVVSAILLYPVVAAIAAVTYADLRWRKEGVTIQQIAGGPSEERDAGPAPQW